MNVTDLLKMNAAVTASAMMIALAVSCEKSENSAQNNDDDITPPVEMDANIPAAEEIIGVWGAIADRLDLNTGNSMLYQMTADGMDYATDSEGNYIVITIDEYVEKWCKDYNSDPSNKDFTAKPEDVVFSEYIEEDGSISFATFDITNESIAFNQGIKGAYNLDVLQVDGTYTYDQEHGKMRVHNLAIEEYPEDIDIYVRKDEEGNMIFTYSGMYLYSLRTYDGTVEYTAFTPVSYICRKGEIPAPSESSENVKCKLRPGTLASPVYKELFKH